MKLHNKKTHRIVVGSLFLFCTFLPQKAFGFVGPCTEKKLIESKVQIVDCQGSAPVTCTVGPTSSVISNNIPEPHKSIIDLAAGTHGVNPNFLAALFLTEQGNVWKDIDADYDSSSAGASGPFQFMPGTWAGYKQDGNGDGVMDVNNFHDAAFGAAKFVATGTNPATPLGDIVTPFAAPDSLLYFAAAYNWGPANVRNKTSPEDALSVAPAETEKYLNNVYTLLTTDLTKSGTEVYGDPRMPSGQLISDGGLDVNKALTAGVCSGADQVNLSTQDAEAAKRIILSSQFMIWGNYGSAVSQKADIINCIQPIALVAIATMAEKSGVNIPVNALATDHGGCNAETGSHHNVGRAIDIGYYGNNAAGADRHVADGDTLYKFLIANKDVLDINQLIWQYPPDGYGCMNNGTVGACSELYSQATMNDHYHHIHVSFGK